MGIRVDVLPLSENTPGQGWLRISGWEEASEGLVYSVQSSQTRDFLQPGKQWSNVAHWFPLSGLVAVDGALQVQVGPDFVDPLLAASGSANFRFELNNPNLGESEVTMVRLDKHLVSSIAWTGAKAPEPAPAPAPTPAPAPVARVEAPAPVVETPAMPEPAPEPTQAATPPVAATKINRLVWLLPLLALIVTGGLWWFMQKPAMVDAAPAPTPPPPAPPTEAQACTLESMQSQPELAFVQACIQKAPGSAALLEVINLAKANNHCAVAQRLYANRAQGGDIEIASAYAREYDPKYLQPSECFKAPDNATAAYWYETILAFDQNNAEAKQRFEELKQ
ncbi:hypothetical protein N5D52_09835 [Pseudomonas sp. GD03860]|uniref:hypothetical protein n=1 Tax=Pseudomonas TaxID=286 RepID=UPI00236401CA|nr:MULTISPECIES: hypothetical protein [Pseudomonas]MDD2059805.1 hypothetical protein [Pseudomonas putida]MDH0637241.1 hypothetical protein [Pseudomonas sp. GD03860]